MKPTKQDKQQESTFSVIFVMQKGKTNANGTAPIMARVTVNGKMTHMSTKMRARPDRRDAKNHCTLGKTPEEKQMNKDLLDWRDTIRRRYNEKVYHGEVLSADMIKSSMMSLDEKAMSVGDLFKTYISDYEKLVLTKDYGKESFFRYKVCQDRVMDFIKKTYGASDMALTSIDRRFLDKLYLYLRTERKLNNTAVKFLHRFGSVYKMARDNGWGAGNPFAQQKLHLDKVDRGYLTMEEVERVYNHEFESKRLEKVRDVFIFCCYTGLPYIDAFSLTYDQVITWADGNMWLSLRRTKTKVPVNVRLLDAPLRIMAKYRDELAGTNRVLPVPTNQKCNDYLKEIGGICGIHKPVTFHMARHTFATTITLGHGVPIESVSKMLGHTKISTTQIYARITDQKVNGDMESLASKLNGLLTTAPKASAQSVRESKHGAKIRLDAEKMGITTLLQD